MPWGISWGEVALLLLSVWTVIGALGVFVSFMRGERNKAKRHMGWIAAIWLLYLAVLLTVSLTARRRQVAIGQEQCFGGICVAVLRATTIPGYLVQKGEQVVRVTVQISNHSSETQHDSRLTAYLVDDHSELRPEWLRHVSTVAVTAGASAPEHLVQELLDHLRDAYGFASIEEVELKEEDVRFSLPSGLDSSLLSIATVRV